MMSSTTITLSTTGPRVTKSIDEEAVFAPYFMALQAYEEKEIERRNERMQNARTPLENRYADDDPEFAPPSPPSIRLTPYHYVTLADGRRAIRLDSRRALPLCGIMSPVILTEAEPSARPVYQGIKCRACQGFHLSRPTRIPQASSQIPAMVPEDDLEVRCPKCHASVLEIQHDGPFFTIHCFCGWLKEGRMVNHWLSQAELDHNAQVLASAPVRECSDWDSDEESEGFKDGTFAETSFHEACENGDIDFDEDVIPFSDERMDENASREDASETLSDSDEHLVALENRLWLDHRLRPLRVSLLEATMLNRIPDDVVNLVWAVAANLAESCEHLSAAAQREVAEWVCQASPEDLEGLLPEREDDDDPTVPRQLPEIWVKIRKWQQACRQRVNRFRFRQAGIRILAPKFGVSRAAFAVACQN